MRWLIIASLLSLASPTAMAEPEAASPEASAARMLAELKQAEARPPPGIMTDRPIYLPGETIWFRTWHIAQTVELLDGRGQPVAVGQRDPGLRDAGSVEIPGDAGAGRYRLRVGGLERPILVERSRRPPLRFELRFARASHRPGEPVAAAIEVRRADGAPLKDRAVAATVTVEGAPPLELTGRTDRAGRLGLGFELPAGHGAARLNLRVEADGAVTGFTRPIPLTPAAPTIDLLPEGGAAIVGLPGRVYVAARRAGGRPADVAGQVVDDRQQVVAEVASVIDGRARFEWTPAAGRRYRLRLPDGISVPLPEPQASGCAMRAVDDFTDARPTIGVDLRCTRDRPLIVIASRDEAVLAVASTRAGPDAPTRVELKTAQRRGPVTVTVLTPDGVPVAERVVFRHRDRGLKVTVTADRAHALPGDWVTFTVRAQDADGRPVQGDLAFAVVDDGAVAHADDQSPDLVAQMLLLPIVRGHLERAGRYLAPGAEAGRALDLLMGTAGYRRFEIIQSQRQDRDGDGIDDRADACPDEPETINGVADDDGCPDAGGRPTPPRASPTPPAGPPPAFRPREGVRITAPAPPPPPSEPRRVVISSQRIEVRAKIFFRAGSSRVLPISRPLIEEVGQVMIQNPQVGRVEIGGHTDSPGSDSANLRISQARADAVRHILIQMGVRPDRLVAVGYGEAEPINDNRTAEGRAENRRVEFRILQRDPRSWRGVRRFPPPPPPTEARDDFRETVAWIPRVRLEAGRGTADVRLSEASTAFRAVAQGTGAGAVGRGEAVVSARKPLMLEVDSPRRVVQGDRFEVPVTVVNRTRRAVRPRLSWSSPMGEGTRRLARLKPGARIDAPLTLSAGEMATGEIDVRVAAGKLSDQVVRPIQVTGRGFPHSFYRAGSLGADSTVRIEWPGGPDPRALDAQLSLSASASASLYAALAAMIRAPTGCFEQTTAKHWPNVMALRLFERTPGSADPAVIDRTRRWVADGARRLATFQGAEGGFAMYSGAGAQPGLTAYAVVQLHDTGVDRAIITRAAGWLAGRRARAPRISDDRRPAVSAWIDWALAVGGQPAAVSPLTPDAAADPYVLAVRILTLVAADRRGEAAPLAEALQAMAEPDGRWTGARSSITGSRGAGLVVETTALAVRALAALDRAPTLRSRALDALDAARRGGAWHTTQATVQALAATLSHVRAYGGSTPGEVRVRVDGRVVWRERVDARRMTAYVVPLTAHLADAATVEVSQTGGGWIGWSAVGRWTEALPVSAASARLTLATALDRPTLSMGRAGTLTATVSAASGDGSISDPLLRIGLPAGLEVDRDQLRDWTEQGRVALAEVRPGEVVLYLDRLDAGATARFPLTVTARRRGRFGAAASSAYPYYSPDPSWTPGLAVEIR